MNRSPLTTEMQYSVESTKDINHKIAKIINGEYRKGNLSRETFWVKWHDLPVQDILSRKRIGDIMAEFDTLLELPIGLDGTHKAKARKPVGIYQLKTSKGESYMQVTYTEDKMTFAEDFGEIMDLQFATIEEAKAYIEQLGSIQYDNAQKNEQKEKAISKAKDYIMERQKEDAKQQGE